MATGELAMPRVQHQGPASHCKVDGHHLGWASCTAYSMAMGIDAYTAGEQRPKGCAIRKHTGDTQAGLTIRQVAEVAQEHYDVLVTRRTAGNVIAPEKAAELAGKGRGFVLQGNTGALLRTKSQSTKGPVQHAVWVQRVEFDADGRPAFAVVFDPCADGRPLSADRNAPKAPQKWPWERVLAFAAALQLGGDRALGPGKFYAGFIPRLRPSPVPGSANATQDVAGVTLRFGAKKTSPFPDRTRAKPPAGRRVNVRRRPDRLDPDDVTDKLGDGDLFIAYQRTSKGAKPPGSRSRTWFGNRDGTAWVHVSGLRHVGGST